MRYFALAIANEIQRLRACVLRAVASNSPLARNTRMQVWKGCGKIFLQEWCANSHACMVQEPSGRIDVVVRRGAASNDDVWRHDISMPQCGCETAIFTYQRFNRTEMSILDKVGNARLCGQVSPLTRTQVTYGRKCTLNKIACKPFEQEPPGLPSQFRTLFLWETKLRCDASGYTYASLAGSVGKIIICGIFAPRDTNDLCAYFSVIFLAQIGEGLRGTSCWHVHGPA